MGLYVSFTPPDLGYQMTLSQEILGELVEVSVDYGPACEAFVSTFLERATSLVPVDTGYLRSTISASTDGYSCQAEAIAEYAQYVEYGTFKMIAKPYFTPAVEAGIAAFRALAGEALSEAQQELHDICESIVDAFKATLSDGSLMGDLGATLAAGVAMLLLFPILVNLYGILETLHPGDHNFVDGVAGTSVQVIIT